MTDIFISYANEDRDSAARLAAHLESVGWRVWWDRRIPAGRTWRSILADALSEMRCMIVLWSAHSVDSPWVAEEAEEARRLKKILVPVLIERVEPPMGFRAIQAADLTDWNGSPEEPSLQQLVSDLKSLLGTPSQQPHERHEAPPPKYSALAKWLSRYGTELAAGGLAVLVVFAIWKYWPFAEPLPVSPSTEIGEPHAEAISRPQLEGLAVHGPRQTIKPSERLKLTVTGRYSDGSESELRDDIEWSSSDSRVATINATGEVQGLKTGTTAIVARIGALTSSEWTLGVGPAKPTVKRDAPRLIALTVRSKKKELFENEKVLLRARAVYSDDSVKDLSDKIIWQSSNRAVASVNSQGELRALRAGKVEVVARAHNVLSAPETFLVKEPLEKKALQSGPVHTGQPPTPDPAASLRERAKAKIGGHLDRAQTFREQGNYAAALAELEKARTIDRGNKVIDQEIEKTKRACFAEKVLGNKPDC